MDVKDIIQDEWNRRLGEIDEPDSISLGIFFMTGFLTALNRMGHITCIEKGEYMCQILEEIIPRYKSSLKGMLQAHIKNQEVSKNDY